MVADIHFVGVAEFRGALDAFVARIEAVVAPAVAEGAHLIEAAAKQRAPAKTGTLRRSIRVFGPVSAGIGSWQAAIGPTVAYGRRIELGFHGTDRLGRTYDQEGQPYLGPAFDEVVEGPLQSVFAKWWGSAGRF